MLASWFRPWLKQQSPPSRRRPARTPTPRRSRLLVELLENRLAPATITVTNTNDYAIAQVGGQDLPNAILSMNAHENIGGFNVVVTWGQNDQIKFNIGTSGGLQTIFPESLTITPPPPLPPHTIPAGPLPAITDPGLTIDGTSQPGYAGTPLIVLQGSASGNASFDGLTITGPGCTVKGLAINRFRNGIVIQGSAATGNTVAGDFLGTDHTGTVAAGNTLNGVFINGASANTVGGTATAGRNVIGGNGTGILIANSGASDNLVEGNDIGVGFGGRVRLPNGVGVHLGNLANDMAAAGYPGADLFALSSASAACLSSASARGFSQTRKR
jgi:titin